MHAWDYTFNSTLRLAIVNEIQQPRKFQMSLSFLTEKSSLLWEMIYNPNDDDDEEQLSEFKALKRS